MNAKLKKIIKLTAAALFLIALIINVKVTLDDPFQMINEQALATGGSGGGGDCAGGSCTHKEYFAGEIKWNCTACCPEGKSPSCDSFGCKCT